MDACLHQEFGPNARLKKDLTIYDHTLTANENHCRRLRLGCALGMQGIKSPENRIPGQLSAIELWNVVRRAKYVGAKADFSQYY